MSTQRIYRDIIVEIGKKYPQFSLLWIEDMVHYQFKMIKEEIVNNPGSTSFMGKLGEIGPPKVIKKSPNFHDWVKIYKEKINCHDDRTPLYYNGRKYKTKVPALSVVLEDNKSEDTST